MRSISLALADNSAPILTGVEAGCTAVQCLSHSGVRPFEHANLEVSVACIF